MDTLIEQSNHPIKNTEMSLNMTLKNTVNNYLSETGEEPLTGLLYLFTEVFEKAVFEAIMLHPTIRGNQSKAARTLGISRTTLRKKLKLYDLLNEKSE